MKNSFTFFKKFILASLVLFLLHGGEVFSQGLTGTKTINPFGIGSTNFVSLKMAIDTLNFYGVGINGVSFEISSGISETAPTGGYVITATGTQTAPIIFIKVGSGNNPEFISYTGGTATSSSAIPDGILKLIGSDYITIDGLTFTENAANLTNSTSMEFGIGLFKQNATNGCKNNTIKNCSITLNRINNATGSGPLLNGSIGILIINASAIAATTAITPTTVSGSNSFNKIYSNIIENTNIGIGLNGYSTTSPFTNCDFGNDIGGNAEFLGNTILNFGGGGITSAAAGIQIQNNYDFNISNNTIDNNNGSGINHGNAILRGIFCNASATSASGVVSNNTLSLKSSGTTTAVYVIDVQAGSTAANNTINIHSNRVLNCTYLTATSGAFYGIYASSSASNVIINNNKIRGIDYSATTLTGTGTVYGIYNAGATANLLINNNSISNVTSIGTTGNTNYGIYAGAGTIQTITNDSIYDININGTGSSGAIYGISTSTGTIDVNNNTIFNLLNNKTTGTSTIYGIYNLSSPTNENYNNNLIHHLTHSGAGIVRGIYTFTTTGVRKVSGNTIHALSNVGAICEGINQQSSTPSIFNNKIYDITSGGTAGTANGLTIQSGNTSVNVYNNFISDIKAPAASSTTDAVRGINITNSSATTDINIYHNTISINPSSTGVNFSATALWHTTSTTATTARLVLRNNILINKGTHLVRV